MEQFVIAVHILVALAIVALVLLQQGKGAEMGASFGAGSSQTLFGSQGSGTFLSHTTAILVTIFFATSLGLALIAKHKSAISADVGVPAAAVIETHNKKAAEKTATPAGEAPTVASPSASANDAPSVPAPSTKASAPSAAPAVQNQENAADKAAPEQKRLDVKTLDVDAQNPAPAKKP